MNVAELKRLDLNALLAAGALSEIDVQFAHSLKRLSPEPNSLVHLAAALTSRAVQAGHVCLDLAAPAPLLREDETALEIRWPDLSEWRQALQQSPLVGDGTTPTPLVLRENRRLYLHRYADYEERLARSLKSRLQGQQQLDEEFVRGRIEHWFGPGDPERLDWQRLAAFLALNFHFLLISGGPGTGKTTTVTKIILLLEEHAVHRGTPLRITLLAPTGKAAQRLTESIQQGLERLDVSPEISQTLPSAASTIHRALGTFKRTPTQFRHGKESPLESDIVIVDEASMIDLALMTKLVEAVAPNARLILLGDRDQLASVEAGAIFGDLVSSAPQAAYATSVADRAERIAGQRPPSETVAGADGIVSHTVHLVESHRYREDSSIGRFAEALRARDVAAMLDVVEHGSDADLVKTDSLSDASVAELLALRIREGYSTFANAKTIQQRLAALDEFRILTPHRSGRYGVSALNQLAEQTLSQVTDVRASNQFYDGRPIMITENDYQLELFNGDVGVVGRSADGSRLVSWFRGTDALRSVPLARLPSHQTVFAMTVHKSQGSEFGEVLIVLPREPSPILTRELLYTGATRAKSRVRIVGSRRVLRACAETGITRASGLAQRLLGEIHDRDI